MIQKAIVESIINNYQLKVRIPKYDKLASDGVSYNDLSTGIICTYPGTILSYAEGDVVLVGFENDEVDKPVVLGLLYNDKQTDSSIKIPDISNQLDNTADKLNNISKRNNFLHIKYSNDGGVTFTSLYDYSDNSYNEVTNTYSNSNIIINPLSSVLMWNISDGTNAERSSDFNLSIYISGDIKGKEVETTELTGQRNEIPAIYKHCTSVKIAYEVSPKISSDINNFNISLYTDKDTLGSVPGDYLGFYYSNSEIPSLSPIDYSWASIKIRIQKFIDEAFGDILKRVQRNEKYLYGTTVEEDEQGLTSDLGISSALKVQSNNLNISYKPTIDLSNKIQIDTQNNILHLGDITFSVDNSGGLIIN